MGDTVNPTYSAAAQNTYTQTWLVVSMWREKKFGEVRFGGAGAGCGCVLRAGQFLPAQRGLENPQKVGQYDRRGHEFGSIFFKHVPDRKNKFRIVESDPKLVF